MQANQDWWHAWYQRRWPHSPPRIGANSQSLDVAPPGAAPPGGWQQSTLTRGLHMPWRFKPVISRRLLYYGLGRQVLQSHDVAERQLWANLACSTPAGLCVHFFGQFCMGNCLQDGWTRRGHPPAVLVEGDWALLTCTPDREGPTGGRDRLQLIKLDTLHRTKENQVCGTTICAATKYAFMHCYAYGNELRVRL